MNAAAEVGTPAPDQAECPHCRKQHAPRTNLANGCYLSTDDVPIDRRAVLCSCGAIVRESDAASHCLGHAGDD
jgi:hypothetical protein